MSLVTVLTHLPEPALKEEGLLGLTVSGITAVGACGTVCSHRGGSGGRQSSRTRKGLFQNQPRLATLVTYFLQLGNSQRFHSFPNYCHQLGNRHSKQEPVRAVLD